MKLTGIHVNKLLASLLVCIILLLSSLLPYTSAIAAPPLNDPTSGPGDGRVNLVSASSEEVIIDVRVDDFDAAEVTVKGTTYQRLSLHETAATQEIGKPELPIIGQFVAIPPGASLSIDIVDVDQSTLPGYMVYPAQEPPLDQGDWEEPPFTIDEGFYQQDTFYPAEYVTASAPQTMRDVTVVWLSIHPLQFNPARRELRFNKYMRIRLTFIGGADSFLSDGGARADDAFQGICQSLVLNCGSVEQPLMPVDGYPPDAVGAEYLIISAPDYVSAANTLAEWKNKRGIKTVVKTTSDTGTTTTSIKNYIQDAYNTWTPKPAYVLFFGDVNGIPVYYVTTHPSAGGHYPAGHKTGTDLYYATMGGSSDRLPDIHLGRISVDSLTEATHIVSKIIAYETSPPSDTGFYNRVAMGAYFQDVDSSHPTPDGKENRLFVRTSEDIRDYLISESYDVERIYCTESNIDPRWYYDGTAIPTELRKPGFAWDGDTADIVNAVNDGVFILNHRDHGYYGGWGDPKFYSSDIDSLNNGTETPVVFSINCETGFFDTETDGYAYGTDPGFAEKFLRYGSSGQKGAVGVFAASRISFSWHNDRLVKGFYDSIWPDFITTYSGSNPSPSYRMGDTLSYGKYYYSDDYGSSSTYAITTLELFHYHGDPTMEIWTANPSNLTVSHAATANAGSTSFTVNVSQNGALVSIVQNGVILGTATSSGGSATVSLSPAFSTGTAYVTVTKHNYRPYQGTVTVSATQVPAAPSNLSATVVSQTQINLSWTDNSSNEDGFKIERSPDGTSGWTQIATVGANTTTYSDTGLTCNTPYYYRVRAYKESENSDYSNTDSATTNACSTAPAAPSNLSATAVSQTQINLSWTDNSNNEDGFKIERSPDGTSGWTQIATVGANTTTYSNTGLVCDTTYYYRVCAYNGSGDSGYSNTDSATTNACSTVPTAPSGLSATAASQTQINLSWSDNSNNEGGFKVERSPDGTSSWAQIATVGANVTTYSNTGLTCDTTYYYRVRAYNASGDSAYSNTDSATTNACGGSGVNSNWTSSAPTIDGHISSGEWTDAATYDIAASTQSLQNQEQEGPFDLDLPESLLQETGQWQMSFVPEQEDAAAVTLYAMNDGTHLYLAIDNPNDTTVNDSDQIGVYFDDNPLPSDGQWTNTICGHPDGEGNFWVRYDYTDDQVKYREWIAGPEACTPIIPAPGASGMMGFSSGHAQAEIAVDLTSSALRAAPGNTINMYLWIADYNTGSSVQHGIWPSTAVYSDPSTYGPLTLGSGSSGVNSNWTTGTPTIDGYISSGEWTDAAAYNIANTESLQRQDQEQKGPFDLDLPESLLQETGRWQMSFVPEQEDVAAVTLYAMNDGTHLYLAIDNPNDTTDDSWDQAGVYFDDNPLPSDGQWTNTICGNQDGEGNFWVMTDTVKYREWIVGPTTCDVIDPAPGTLGAVGHSSGHAQAEVAMDLTLSALRAAPGDTINMRLWIYDYSTGSFGGVWPPNSSYLDPSTYGPLTLDSGSGTQPPAAPSNLSATAVSQTQINLSWTDNSSNEDGFKIERSPDGTSGWTQIATVGANTTTYSNTSLACNTTYHYRVRAYEGSDNSGYSNTDSATTDACGGCEDTYEPDNAYSEANVIAANGVAQTHNFHVAGDIDWVKFTATAGRVYTITTSNLDSGNDTYLYLHDTDGTTVLESNDDCPGGGLESCINNWTAPSNATYYVKVHQYYSSGGCTGYGYDLGVVGSSSSGAPPAAPSNLSATAVSQTQINLSWTDNSSNEDGFEIERSPNGTSSWTQIATPVANTTSYSNTGLLCNTTYYYRVRAYNGSGYSSYSNASATTSTCGSCEDTYEPDNEYTAAELITVNGAAQTHNFHVAGDEDWVQFTALASKPYTITTSNLDSGNDTYLYLYDTDGTTVLESNDDCKGSTTLLDLSSCINNWSAPVDGTYYVKVRYYDNSEGGCAGYGYDLAISDGASPAAPGWLTATPVSQDEIDLTWTDNSDNEDGFNIERSSGTSGWTEIATVGANTATYADSNDLSPNTTYNYRVNAYNGSGYSHYSNTASTAISASVSSSSVYLPLIMRNSQ